MEATVPKFLSEQFQDAVVEMMFAGVALARILDGPACYCGAQTDHTHSSQCPVARFHASVESVKKAVA